MNNSASTTKCSRCKEVISKSSYRCPSCLAWLINGHAMAPVQTDGGVDEDQTVLLSNVRDQKTKRYTTVLCDANLGGGLPTDAVVLLGGKAGAGKSTLALQLADMIAVATAGEVLYIAAEESGAQIRSRSTRLNLKAPHLLRLSPMGADNDILEVMRSRKPKAVIIDSLPGFVSNPDDAVTLCHNLKLLAVELDSPFIVIDHVNKQDDFAGLEKLQHEVDITITLFPTGEGELRSMVTLKNRYGKANEETLLEMTAEGLVPVEETDDDFEQEDENE
jgi:DNA repair protein RadA/Sms